MHLRQGSRQREREFAYLILKYLIFLAIVLKSDSPAAWFEKIAR